MTRQKPSSDSLFSLFARLFHHISVRRRRQFVLLMFLTLIGSVAEVVSLGAVLPFIGVLTDPQKVFDYPGVSMLLDFFGVTSAEGMVLPITIAFAGAALFAGGVRVCLLWVSIRLTFATGADLSLDVYRRTLYQPYHVHVARNSSEIISGITQKVGAGTNVLTSVVTVVTSLILFVSILMVLVVMNPIIAITAMLVFGSCYGLIAWKARSRLASNSKIIAQEQTRVVKVLQEGLGAIRDVLLDGAQRVYCDVYRDSVFSLSRAGGSNNFITLAPRYVMESLGMVLIASMAYALSFQPGGVGAALPVLGALALGAQRAIPLLQLLYGNWSVVAGGRVSLMEVLELLDQYLPDEAHKAEPAALAFSDAITLDDVFFQYGKNSAWVLEGVNLRIPGGARIGFVGSTGSGKSTMLDLIISLLEPTQGRLLVDGEPVVGDRRRAWQRNIAHVPQSIFLTDASIAENIAFGVLPEDIDMDRVCEAAEKAQIDGFIESSPESYKALVGERGVRLSGGQRQRIGIARALYKQAKVLVFDEATSALDGVTEEAVMRAIECLDRDLTILIIAHRLSTLRHCDVVVRLEHGKIVTQEISVVHEEQ